MKLQGIGWYVQVYSMHAHRSFSLIFYELSTGKKLKQQMIKKFYQVDRV